MDTVAEKAVVDQDVTVSGSESGAAALDHELLILQAQMEGAAAMKEKILAQLDEEAHRLARCGAKRNARIIRNAMGGL